MLRAFFMITALLFSSIDRGSALDMSVKTNDEERLVYLHLWGPIVSGDDQKFKNLVLLYIKKGYLIFEVNVFSSGGDVRAAMDIGNQVRMLQARTKSPMRFINEPEYAQCWFVASASHGGVRYHPNSNYKRDLSTNDGDSWCDCASACFLIWSSGVTREGNYVGIHRFKFDELFYGNLPPSQARAMYERAEVEFRQYLLNLNVPSAILDRLFATDSKSMYYLNKSELEILQSTPYLEELTEAKCPPDMTRREYNPDGSWSSTTFDPVRINCYRGIVKELMRDGAQNYLIMYGGDHNEVTSNPAQPKANDTPVVAVPAKPVIAPPIR